MSTPPKLRVVPNYAAAFLDLGPLDPGSWGIVRLISPQRLRVTAARVAAEFTQSRAARLVRRIPGIARFVRGHDATQRAWATAQVRLDYIAVGNHTCPPDKCDDLPIAPADCEISARVTNMGKRALVARVLVEGVLS